MKNCLLLGRKAQIVDKVKAGLEVPKINLFGGTSLEEVKEIFNQETIDVVIMGAGIDLEIRLEIIRFIFENSKSTTVHMKDWESGPAGMMPFVNGVLGGR